MRLIPKEEKFFDEFEQGTSTLVEAANLLLGLLKDFQDVPRKVAALKDLEHRVDGLVRETTERMNKTFITPFDREDIHTLISQIDDVADFIEGAADRILLYRVQASRPEAVALAEIIVQATAAAHEAVVKLRHMRGAEDLLRLCGDIKRLEEAGDRVHREAVAQLFEKEKDPINLIKWKEIFENLEEAIDRCEDMAEEIEGIALKNAS
jgi:predicted phosphate transport protein (TIGR00153 family)